MTLSASLVSCTTFVYNDANFSISVCKVSALYIFACISDQVLELIATCSFKDD